MITPRTNRYSQWQIGDTTRLRHILSAEDVLTFVELTRDTNPVPIGTPAAPDTGKCWSLV